MNAVKTFVDPMSICLSENLGENVRVHAFCKIERGVKLGSGTIISDFSLIRKNALIRENVRVGDRCTIGENVEIARDVIIHERCEITKGVKTGQGVIIQANSVVIYDVPSFAIISGTPSKIIDYTTSSVADDEGSLAFTSSSKPLLKRRFLSTKNCFLEPIPNFTDIRGSLTAIEKNKGVPFTPKRVFLVHGVNSEFVRGEHAHFKCEQFLIAISGTLSVFLDDGTNRSEVVLTDKHYGLYLAPMVWGVQYKFSNDSVLMVLASHEYDSSDYIRNYDDFFKLVNSS